ncbi:MAG: DUF6077 domain-containing protein [Lachnospiraceae bacterium]
MACIAAIVLLTVVSFLGGRFLLYSLHQAESGCCVTMAAGSVVLFFGMFIIQFVTVWKALSFSAMKWGAVVYALILIVGGCFASCKRRRRLSGEQGYIRKWLSSRNREQWFLYGAVVLFFVLNVGVMLWYEPYFGNDMTVEEVCTILTTGTVCRYHPGTGAMLELGMNMEAKLNFMPGLYAVLCDVTGADPYLLICRWIPVWGLLLNYAVIYLLLREVFGKANKMNKAAYAMILYGILLLFGDYQAYTYAFRLLHQGWNPYVILWASMAPFILVCVIRLGRAACRHKERRESKHAKCME